MSLQGLLYVWLGLTPDPGGRQHELQGLLALLREHGPPRAGLAAHSPRKQRAEREDEKENEEENEEENKEEEEVKGVTHRVAVKKLPSLAYRFSPEEVERLILELHETEGLVEVRQGADSNPETRLREARYLAAHFALLQGQRKNERQAVERQEVELEAALEDAKAKLAEVPNPPGANSDR